MRTIDELGVLARAFATAVLVEFAVKFRSPGLDLIGPSCAFRFGTIGRFFRQSCSNPRHLQAPFAAMQEEVRAEITY